MNKCNKCSKEFETEHGLNIHHGQFHDWTVSVGRPTKRTPEIDKKIEEAAALDASVEEIAFYAGIHKETLYAWMRDDKELSDRVAELRERPILKARQTIVKSLEEAPAAQWYLSRKRKKEFAERQEVTGPEGKPIPLIYGGLSGHESDQEDIQPQQTD